MYQIKAKVIANKKITPNHYKLVLSAPEIAKKAEPGQFVNVRIQEGYEPFLRKPFSISGINNLKSNIELLYKVVGKGTGILSKKNAGEYLDVLGPIGKGYVLPLPSKQIAPKNIKLILIGGGVGISSFHFFAQRITKKTSFKVSVLIGASNKNELLYKDEFKKLGCDVKSATDDGTCGFKGLITDMLRRELVCYADDSCLPVIYACGPFLMLKEIAKIAENNNIPCQVCMEKYMACGVGACLGCIIKVRDDKNFKYVKVCKDGPVFDAKKVIWNEE